VSANLTVPQVWIGALVTIGLWTWLIDRQNPVFELLQHLYIGLSFAYSIALQWHSYLKPALVKLEHGQWAYVVPVLLGLMIYTRYFKPVDFLSRWAVAYFVGYGAGYVLAFQPAVFLGQVSGSFVHLWGSDAGAVLAKNWLFFLLLVASLAYFLFTVSRERGVVRYGSGIGRYAIMIALGAGFGATILYRYSLLFGRVYFIFHDWLRLV
jgi:hypothetical protein